MLDLVMLGQNNRQPISFKLFFMIDIGGEKNYFETLPSPVRLDKFVNKNAIEDQNREPSKIIPALPGFQLIMYYCFANCLTVI